MSKVIMGSDLTHQGAVVGPNVSTNPTTARVSTTGAIGLLGSAATILGGVLGHNTAQVQDALVAVGGAGGLGSVLGMIWGHVRAAEAEIEHAIEIGVAKLEQGVTTGEADLTKAGVDLPWDQINAKVIEATRVEVANFLASRGIQLTMGGAVPSISPPPSSSPTPPPQ